MAISSWQTFWHFPLTSCSEKDDKGEEEGAHNFPRIFQTFIIIYYYQKCLQDKGRNQNQGKNQEAEEEDIGPGDYMSLEKKRQ